MSACRVWARKWPLMFRAFGKISASSASSFYRSFLSPDHRSAAQCCAGAGRTGIRHGGGFVHFANGLHHQLLLCQRRDKFCRRAPFGVGRAAQGAALGLVCRHSHPLYDPLRPVLGLDRRGQYSARHQSGVCLVDDGYQQGRHHPRRSWPPASTSLPVMAALPLPGW